MWRTRGAVGSEDETDMGRADGQRKPIRFFHGSRSGEAQVVDHSSRQEMDEGKGGSASISEGIERGRSGK